MWLLTLALATVSSAADPSAPRGADQDKARLRLEKRIGRHDDHLGEVEARFRQVCELAPAPEDARAARRRTRAESALITARARHTECRSRLDAWEEPERTVEVLFATNREVRSAQDGRSTPVEARRTTDGSEAGRGRSGAGRYGNRDTDQLGYGRATVFIPARHPAGALDRRLQVAAVDPLAETSFQGAVAAALDRAGPDAELLVYVHGYNNSFEYSARRLAQIANDLDRPVVPVLYSWPSSGGTWFAGLKYTFDENAAARSSAPFADLLGELVASTDAPVTVLAHSMGSRVVADALIDLERRRELSRPLADLVFAAPDLDVSVFARRYLDTTLQSAGRLTVYCADDDRALLVSRSVHGGYDRLGSCSEAATVLLDHDRVEIVDASKLWVNLLDHDKVASSPRLLADLQLLVDGVPAAERALVAERDRYVLPP